jgi:hypothetical protein
MSQANSDQGMLRFLVRLPPAKQKRWIEAKLASSL